jgi:hypothetical protein
LHVPNFGLQFMVPVLRVLKLGLQFRYLFKALRQVTFVSVLIQLGL